MRNTSPVYTHYRQLPLTPTLSAQTHQPRRRAVDLARGDAGHAVAREVGRVDGGEEEVDGVDRELRAAKAERDGRVARARDRVPALAVALCARNRSVDRVDVLK